MNKTDSKARILRECQRWSKDPDHATYDEMSAFHLWLMQKHPDLLQWRVRGGSRSPETAANMRWQELRGWLNVRTPWGTRTR